jgi:hypothetical protein
VSRESQYESPLEEWREVLDGAFYEVEDEPRRRITTGERMIAALLIAVFLAPLALPVLHFLQADDAEAAPHSGPFTARATRAQN